MQHVLGEAQQLPLHPADPDGQQTPLEQTVPAGQQVATPVDEMQHVPEGQQAREAEPIQQAFGDWQQVLLQTAALGQHAPFRQTLPAAQQVPLQPTVPVAQQIPLEQVVPAGQQVATPVDEMQQVPEGQQVVEAEPTQQALGD